MVLSIYRLSLTCGICSKCTTTRVPVVLIITINYDVVIDKLHRIDNYLFHK